MSEHAMAPQTSAQPAAGWYHESGGQLRYWDGQAWTQHTAAAQPGWVSTAAPEGPRGVDILAIITLVLGFLPLIGCLAVVTGFISLRSIKQSGRRGRIPALIGMTFGFLWLADVVLRVVVAAAWAPN
jgi:Domain of unknown function (DUF4190)/Protein of unknown function (DUF2510)